MMHDTLIGMQLHVAHRHTTYSDAPRKNPSLQLENGNVWCSRQGCREAGGSEQAHLCLGLCLTA